jgi:hypothetical protein
MPNLFPQPIFPPPKPISPLGIFLARTAVIVTVPRPAPSDGTADGTASMHCSRPLRPCPLKPATLASLPLQRRRQSSVSSRLQASSRCSSPSLTRASSHRLHHSTCRPRHQLLGPLRSSPCSWPYPSSSRRRPSSASVAPPHQDLLAK